MSDCQLNFGCGIAISCGKRPRIGNFSKASAAHSDPRVSVGPTLNIGSAQILKASIGQISILGFPLCNEETNTPVQISILRIAALRPPLAHHSRFFPHPLADDRLPDAAPPPRSAPPWPARRRRRCKGRLRDPGPPPPLRRLLRRCAAAPPPSPARLQLVGRLSPRPSPRRRPWPLLHLVRLRDVGAPPLLHLRDAGLPPPRPPGGLRLVLSSGSACRPLRVHPQVPRPSPDGASASPARPPPTGPFATESASPQRTGPHQSPMALTFHQHSAAAAPSPSVALAAHHRLRVRRRFSTVVAAAAASPAATNDYDCGLYVMLFMEYFDGKRLLKIGNDVSPLFRRIVVHRLITSRFNEVDVSMFDEQIE
ncbi:hypothetical protein U9M48_015668 [Paspalum notatum var. saurae]|uniref:Ubiquitin-like protease family profile domain-containing protein n=1 Tax=Paspalum notatum var. saurae TaxID=547442 RepID=A0AAQ3WMB0_PASNO